jgi:hypothetical protein
VPELIAARPGGRAPDPAASLGLETPPFERDVRKRSGLTESPEAGSLLSPRDRVGLRAAAADGRAGGRRDCG